MIDILRELGNAKRNQQIALSVIEHHKEEFRKAYTTNPLQAGYHLRECRFWIRKLITVNRHIAQQHKALKEAIRSQTGGR